MAATEFQDRCLKPLGHPSELTLRLMGQAPAYFKAYRPRRLIRLVTSFVSTHHKRHEETDI